VDNDRIIRELSKKYGKDERIIRAITNTPFLFAKKTINSLEDERPIRIPYMGTFVMRRHKNKTKHLHYVLLKDIFSKIQEQYSKTTTPDEKKAILDSVQVAIDVLIEKGYKDEQFVQHLIEWKSRV
jgi:pyruvate-formate lyase